MSRLNEFYYKLGIMCGAVLYDVYEFNNFDEMINKAIEISNKYKSDMQMCKFVIQTFKDSSYDFYKSCFSQIEVYVNNISTEKESIKKTILKEIEETE